MSDTPLNDQHMALCAAAVSGILPENCAFALVALQTGDAPEVLVISNIVGDMPAVQGLLRDAAGAMTDARQSAVYGGST